jgi:DNA-binding MarR family transcriptional regulator
MSVLLPPLPARSHVEQVLKFEAFYSRRLPARLRAPYIDDPSATALEVLRELLVAPRTHAWLRWRLGVDRGYLSRVLQVLELQWRIVRWPEPADRRSRVIELSHSGRKVAEELARAHEVRVRRILEELPRRQQQRLVDAMAIIEEILERDPIANLLEIHNDG